MAAQAEESESKWNKGSRKEAGRGANQAQKQREFSVMHLNAQGSRGADRRLISLPLSLCLSLSLLNKHV